MKTIDELQAELRLICSELEKLKESQKAETREVNFREIAARAERYPILGHPMWNEDEHTKDMYILMLLSVAALDDDKYEESFMTIYRIAFGMNFSGNMEDLFLSAKSMKFETLDECTRLFLNGNLSLVLLLECMMIAAGFENGKRRAMEYIAQLAVMLNVSKDEIEFLANLARVVLTQDLNEYKTNKLNVYGDIFDCYLNNFENVFCIQIIEASSIFDNSIHPTQSLKSIQFRNSKIILNYDFLGSERKPVNREINTTNMILDYIKYTDTKEISKEDIITAMAKEEERKIKATSEKEMRQAYITAVERMDKKMSLFYTPATPAVKPMALIKRMDVFYQMYPLTSIIFGVMSNHPLAHSKAIAQYIAAGGVIDKQDK